MRPPNIFSLKIIITISIVAIVALLMVFATPSAKAGWSTSNPGINVWMDPNQTDNAKTVYYGGESHTVDAILYGWRNTQYFYLHIKNDNYPSANLTVNFTGVINGPVPSTNWDGISYPAPVGVAASPHCEWESVATWNGSTWVAAHFPIAISGLDNNETALLRVAFNFHNAVGYDASSWFPGKVQVQFAVTNTDNAELYHTITSSWWVWDYNLENTVNAAVADTVNLEGSGNLGDNTLMWLQSAGMNKVVWLKFPLTIPANWGVQHAYLNYYMDSTFDELTNRYIRTLENTTWIENVITYANSGGVAPTAYGTSATPFAMAAGWQTMDITDIIRPRMMAGDSLATVFLYGQGGTGFVSIRSKEYGDGSYAPQLILEIAPMGAVVSPTFNIIPPTPLNRTGAPYPYPGSYDLLLRGRIDNMGQDSSANFTFYLYNESGTILHSYIYPSAMTTTGFFSLTTTGNEYDEYVNYNIRLQCHGNNTQAYTWMPADGYYSFSIVENHIVIPENENMREPCTINNLYVDGITNNAANLRNSLTVGTNNSLSIYFDIAENADNLNNYTTVGSASYTWSVTGYTWNRFWTYTGLDNTTTYYVRARGIDAALNPVWDGKWISFTTLVGPIITEPGFDIIGIFAVFTGGDRAMAGCMVGAFFFLIPLTIVGLAVVAAAKAREHSALVILMFYLTGLFLVTVMSLFPWWFLTFHILIIALYFARGWMSKGG